MHTADVDAVATKPYLPAKHAVHADVPVDSALNAPATQAVHTADVDAVDTPPYEPAEQAAHADVPIVSAL